MLSDHAIGGTALPRVDGTEHLACTPASLRRNARIGRNTLAGRRQPQTFDGGQSIRRQLVEHDEGAEGPGVAGIGDGNIVGIALDCEPDQVGVMLEDGAGVQIINPDADSSRWCRSACEQNRRRIGLRGPENRLDQRRVVRIGEEIVTPIARQISA